MKRRYTNVLSSTSSHTDHEVPGMITVVSGLLLLSICVHVCHTVGTIKQQAVSPR